MPTCTSAFPVGSSKGLLIPYSTDILGAIFQVHDAALAGLQMSEHSFHLAWVVQMADDFCLDIVI